MAGEEKFTQVKANMERIEARVARLKQGGGAPTEAARAPACARPDHRWAFALRRTRMERETKT